MGRDLPWWRGATAVARIARLATRMLRLIGLVTLIVVSACTARSSPTSADTTVPGGALATFAERFDAGIGHRRLVLLMSPT